MKKIYVYLLLLVPSVAIVLFFALTENEKGSNFNDKLVDLSFEDRGYVESTQDLPIVKAFLEKYQNASVTVNTDVTGKTVVYALEKKEYISKQLTNFQQINLSIPINSSDFKPETNKIILQCSVSYGGSGMSSFPAPNSFPNETFAKETIQSLTCLP